MEGRIWRHLTNCRYVDVLHSFKWIKTSLKTDLRPTNEIIYKWTWISQLVSCISSLPSALSSCATRLCRTDLRCLDLRASEESHDGSQEFRYCFGIQAIYLFSSCYLEGATIDVLMGPHILCQAENDLNDSFSEWIMENSVSKSPRFDCLASTLFLLLMFSLFTQIVTETDSHFFFYFKNSESVIRRELWHFPVKWFDSPTVISSVISSSVISVMSSSQASCLVPVCLNEILPADEAIANKKKCMSSFSSGE